MKICKRVISQAIYWDRIWGQSRDLLYQVQIFFLSYQHFSLSSSSRLHPKSWEINIKALLCQSSTRLSLQDGNNYHGISMFWSIFQEFYLQALSCCGMSPWSYICKDTWPSKKPNHEIQWTWQSSLFCSCVIIGYFWCLAESLVLQRLCQTH